MIVRDNRDHIRVLLYSYYTTITGWGVLLRYRFSVSYLFMLIFLLVQDCRSCEAYAVNRDGTEVECLEPML